MAMMVLVIVKNERRKNPVVARQSTDKKRSKPLMVHPNRT
jgi:hypothetical protein